MLTKDSTDREILNHIKDPRNGQYGAYYKHLLHFYMKEKLHGKAAVDLANLINFREGERVL